MHAVQRNHTIILFNAVDKVLAEILIEDWT